MTVVAMSHGELSRYDTLLRFDRGELRVEDAAMLLGVCRRQVYRLLDRLHTDGPEALVSWKRGRPSNRAFKEDLRTRVLDLVRQHYHDFGPTLATEYLAERHQITISHETLRKWMIQAGFWKDRDARRPRPYQPRYRRDCRGELIQIDGSKHWWFEDRGPQCTLLVYIDDATSELMHLQTVESESTFAYMEATRQYIERHGKRVTVCEYPDGRMEIEHEGHVLPYHQFDKMRQVNQPAIVENKHLDAALLLARQMQAIMPHHRKRNNDAPARRDQPMHLFPEPEPPAKIDRRTLGIANRERRPPLSLAELEERGTLDFVIPKQNE